jgi:FeS assembly SUF system protein
MVTEDDVITAIRKVYDPEIPVSIYELGLIYGIDVDSSGTVRVRMTLTAPNCPAAQSLPAEVARRVEEIPGVTSAKVEIVFDPPWDRSMMSEAAQLELGLIHLF